MPPFAHLGLVQGLGTSKYRATRRVAAEVAGCTQAAIISSLRSHSPWTIGRPSGISVWGLARAQVWAAERPWHLVVACPDQRLLWAWETAVEDPSCPSTHPSLQAWRSDTSSLCPCRRTSVPWICVGSHPFVRVVRPSGYPVRPLSPNDRATGLEASEGIRQ
jgi:hypothetical protein